MLGLRTKRHISGKEVIIREPDYRHDAEELLRISHAVTDYSREHSLVSPPNVVKTFFRYRPDHEIERIGEQLEAVIDDLSNTHDKQIVHLLNAYPVMAVRAHTRPFERRWLNVASAVIVPLGLFFYLRMWSFRLRLLRDLRTIKLTNTSIINYTEKHLIKD